ncbi:hypothetical protein F4804DRAFT_186326 [Jackrogersella minutella]|nr:hypothetical protein F4804DRAFT_186326 [Jackrogersella minutella]
MAAYFNSIAVQNAQNPHPKFGYFHGLVPNQNVTSWVPEEHRARAEGGRSIQGVTVEQNARGPNDLTLVSKYNGGVCMTEMIPGSGLMCGQKFDRDSSFWQHQRNFHVGTVRSGPATSIPPLEAAVGDCALRKFVLTQGWRNASFMNEPGYGPRNRKAGNIGHIADELEDIARNDKEFALRWGTQFHRSSESVSRSKAKEASSPPCRLNAMKLEDFIGDEDLSAKEDEQEGDGLFAPTPNDPSFNIGALTSNVPRSTLNLSAILADAPLSSRHPVIPSAPAVVEPVSERNEEAQVIDDKSDKTTSNLSGIGEGGSREVESHSQNDAPDQFNSPDQPDVATRVKGNGSKGKVTSKSTEGLSISEGQQDVPKKCSTEVRSKATRQQVDSKKPSAPTTSRYGLRKRN